MTAFGYPLKSWFASAGMDDGSLAVIMPLVKQMDSTYFEDYWTKEGYLGADPEGSAVRDRIRYETFVTHVFIPPQEEKESGDMQKIDTRNGVDNAWKKMILSSGNKEDADCRIWYFDYTLHGDETKTTNELYVTSYVGGLKQALLDLALWVETGAESLPSSSYQVQAGQIAASENAVERGGIQPVVKVLANGEKCVHVKIGETVVLTAEAEVPDKVGTLTYVEWSFEGEEDFSYKGDFTLSDGGCHGKAECHHTYVKPGTYLAVVRVMSQRDGDKEDLYTQVCNIDRVRIVVE